MNEELVSWYNMVAGSGLEDLVCESMEGAARNLSGMVGRTIEIETNHVELVPISRVSEYAGEPETETIGVYLLIGGDLRGQAILMLSMSTARNLVDLLMGIPVGTTESLGEMETAALGEVGNMMVSGFLNTMAAATGGELRPSPPAVMVDMLGTILTVVASTVAAVSDDLLIVDTVLRDEARAVEVRMWVMPDRVSQRASEVPPLESRSRI